MSITFLETVNKVLSESNETELTSVNFSSAVGVHKTAKNFVNRAHLEICKKEVQWPWLAAANSNTNDPYAGNVSVETTAGVRWYLLKTGSSSVLTDYAAVDWDSFLITTQGATGRTAPYIHKNLKYGSFQEWNRVRQANELADAASEQEYAEPTHVIPSKDGRYFGLSGIPDGAYKVYFNAWVKPTSLSAYSDTLAIPDEYEPVLLDRAGYFMHFFKKEFQEAAMKNAAYKEGLSNMRISLMGRRSDTMRDDRSKHV